jgi:methylamine dehydrogenase heavy chain
MRSFTRWAAALGLALANGAPYAAPPPPLPADHLTQEALPARGPHWVYVVDYAFDNEIDSRVRLYDGDSHRRLGQIDTGFLPGFALAPDGRTSAAATTYFARGGHGARTDVVEFTDTATLAAASEIVLPPKRLQAVPTPFNVAYSTDGRFVYVSYVTPAASFGVLDPAKRAVLAEIDTAGCVLVIPAGPNRVSSLCESGRLLTVTLDAQGHEAARGMSAPFFDADRDPVFVQGVRTAHGYTFLSFLGQVHEVDLSGPEPAFAPPWSLLGPADRAWRPGGSQVGAIHLGLGRLYVPMHRGGEGTHKAGGSEIWVYDLATHARLARWPLEAAGLKPIVAVEVSQDAAPVLFAASDTPAELAIIDAATGKIRHVEKHFGLTPWQLLTP